MDLREAIARRLAAHDGNRFDQSTPGIDIAEHDKNKYRNQALGILEIVSAARSEADIEDLDVNALSSILYAALCDKGLIVVSKDRAQDAHDLCELASAVAIRLSPTD